MGIVLITHDLSLVEKVADRVVVMQDGRIVESGISQQIMTSPQHRHRSSEFVEPFIQGLDFA